MENDNNAPLPNCFHKIMFTFFGMASLLGWNALLTELDFFNNYLSDINPYRSFSFLNYALNISFQFILVFKKDFFSHKFQLLAGIIGSIAFLVLIPLSTMFLGKNEMINKIITSGLVVLMGFTNALCCSGFFSFAGHFPINMIVIFTAGQGISGIGLNILQYIVLASVNIENKDTEYIVGAWIFFGISIAILLLCLFLVFHSYHDNYCKYYLNKSSEIENISKQPETKLLSNFDGDTAEEEQGIQAVQVENLSSEKKDIKSNPSFMYVFKKLWDLDVLACYAYVITFSLFPNVCTSQNIFELDAYNSITIITIYNAFDTIGRYLVDKMPQTKGLNLGIGIGRTLLIATLILNYYFQITDVNLTFTSIFLIVNVAILGITNGMAATLSFGLASKLSEDEIKGQAGGSISFCSILGIFFGSCLAFGTGGIIDAIKKKYS